MPRSGIAFALFCLASVGCSKATAAPTASPASPNAVGAQPLSAAANEVPAASAVDQVEDPNRPWLSAATASDYMLIGQSDQTFGVWVDIPKAFGNHVPTALTLAIDTSGSMRGDNIKHAREAAGRLIDELEDGDIVSLVTFSSDGRVLMPPTALDAQRRRSLHNIIEELSADGGTAMHEGLKVAESQLWETPDTHLVRRLVVISDGKATVGPTAPQELGRIAEVGLRRSIQVTALGVGLDYDELTLNELAQRSNGRLYHVEKSAQLPGIIEDEIALLESTAAAGVEVELVAAPGVEITGTAVARSARSDEGIRVPLGTMFGGQTRELLVRARVHGDGTEGPMVLASVRLHYRDPADGGVKRVQETVLRATVTDDPGLVAEHMHSGLQTLVAVRDASTWAQQASADLNNGDLDAAEEQLARAEDALRMQNRQAKSKVEKERTRRSADKIAKQRSGIKKAKKKKPAARAKATRSISLEANDDAMDAFGY